ncbi:hypothetical protein EBB59_02990 [Lysobacter pythonis]|uniref:Uncharacterized protein n=1 Tax=Solilutibacter pythonis TaxID=2483112 RepID=A0A3M2I191_9GAMM|nr:zeta toxin family protein [Lysobacter pythonis]RMH94145.1 hypothetical protein EBB59_02990 [Lysobacter pythonis]
MNEQSILSSPEHARIFREEILFDYKLSRKSSLDNPQAIILAGQPGSGKGRLSDVAKAELHGDVITVDPDALREFHPQAKEFRRTHPYTWSGDTHPDASQWADELLKATVSGKKNLIFDTTLSDGTWASELINDLQAQGYEVEVRAVAAHRLESELGVNKRFGESLDAKGHGRHVPAAARESIYDKLPASLDTIHANTNAPIRLFNREGAELYDSRHDPRPAGAALTAAREARLKDPAITQGLRDGWREQQGWHRDLPQNLPDNPRVDAYTRGNLLAERSTHQVVERVERTAVEAVDVDHLTRIRPTRLRAGSALGIVGLALDAHEAADTARTYRRLQGQGNATAAESELIHFGSRSVGGFAGAGLGMTVGAAVGVETGPGLLLTGAAGGVVGVLAGDQLAEWTDHRRIHRQPDGQGHVWHYDPNAPDQGWQRRVPIDASLDQIDNPTPGLLRASPALANQLNYQASSTSAELVLGAPPRPRDPFVQASAATDPPSAFPAPWVYQAEQAEWRREVTIAYVERGLSPRRTDVADPERAAALDRAAAATLRENAAHSPAAIAARYEEAYVRHGWAAYGPMPDAVRQARTDLDSLIASDGQRYQRQRNGDWLSDGLIDDSTARGALRQELDATREVVRATLPEPRPVETPPPMTPEARLRDAVTGAYANAGLAPDAARLTASAAAVEATWRSHGLDPGTTALQLRPNADGRYALDSPIASLRLAADGKTYAIAAMTTTEEIQRAEERQRMPAAPPNEVSTPPPANPGHAAPMRLPGHGRPAAARSPAREADTQSDALVAQYIAATAQGDEQAMSAACRAMEASAFGQRFAEESKARERDRLQRLPGRDHPLFAQAVQHLERLGPDVAGYWDDLDMERMAGAIAHEAQRNRLPAIEAIVPTRDGQRLVATWRHPDNDALNATASVDTIEAATQPLAQSLEALCEETREQARQAQAWAQQQQQQQHGALSR